MPASVSLGVPRLVTSGIRSRSGLTSISVSSRWRRCTEGMLFAMHFVCLSFRAFRGLGVLISSILVAVWHCVVLETSWRCDLQQVFQGSPMVPFAVLQVKTLSPSRSLPTSVPLLALRLHATQAKCCLGQMLLSPGPQPSGHHPFGAPLSGPRLLHSSHPLSPPPPLHPYFFLKKYVIIMIVIAIFFNT